MKELNETEIKKRNARTKVLADKMAELILPLLDNEDFPTSVVAMERLFNGAVAAIAIYHGQDPKDVLQTAASQVTERAAAYGEEQ